MGEGNGKEVDLTVSSNLPILTISDSEPSMKWTRDSDSQALSIVAPASLGLDQAELFSLAYMQQLILPDSVSYQLSLIQAFLWRVGVWM